MAVMMIVYGDSWVGKTHFAFSLADVCIDTIDDNAFMMKKFKDEKKYYKLMSIDQKIKVEDDCVVAIDTLYGLKELGREKYLKETGKKAVYPPTEWGTVYEYMFDFIKQFSNAKLVILTTRVKPEYDDEGKKIGTKIDFPDVFEYHADIILRMKIEENKRKLAVFKNRFGDPLTQYGKNFDAVYTLEELWKELEVE